MLAINIFLSKHRSWSSHFAVTKQTILLFLQKLGELSTHLVGKKISAYYYHKTMVWFDAWFEHIG